MANLNLISQAFFEILSGNDKVKLNICILLLGVQGHLTIRHTFRTSYIRIPNLNLIWKAIFEILSGTQSVTTGDEDKADLTK